MSNDFAQEGFAALCFWCGHARANHQPAEGPNPRLVCPISGARTRYEAIGMVRDDLRALAGKFPTVDPDATILVNAIGHLADYRRVERELDDKLQKLRVKMESMVEEPIPMLLWCPDCGQRHVDRGKAANDPHHTHACQYCGHVWKPSKARTIGVQFLPGYGPEDA